MSDVSFTLPTTDEVIELAKRRMLADIERVEAERDRINDERGKIVNELEAQRVITRQLEAEARINEVRAEDTRLQQSIERARNFHHRVFRFLGPVDDESVDRAIDTLTVWDRLSPGAPFEIVFNSPGGGVIAGMDLFDFIQEMRRKGHYITTAARGWAASMGGILLQAGDKRIMGREAYVLIHEIQTHALGKTSEIEDEVAFCKKMQRRVLALFAERSAEAERNGTAEIALTAGQIENGDADLGITGWKRREWWLDSAECLRFGIVDEVR